MFSSNDRIKFLEREIIVFREESLKLYDKLEKTTAELDSYKAKYQDVLQQYQASECTARELIKATKHQDRERIIAQ